MSLVKHQTLNGHDGESLNPCRNLTLDVQPISCCLWVHCCGRQ